MSDSAWAALAGALIGGAASLSATALTGYLSSRSAKRAKDELVAATALLMQDDFYHFQATLARAIDGCRWWSEAEVLDLQISVDDRKTVWAALSDRSVASLHPTPCLGYLFRDGISPGSDRPETITNVVADAQGWMDYLRQRRSAMSATPPTSDDFQVMKRTFALLDVGRSALCELSKRPPTDFSRSHVFDALALENSDQLFAKQCSTDVTKDVTPCRPILPPEQVQSVPTELTSSAGSKPADLVSYATNSYRFLRIAVVVVLLALLCSVVIERLHSHGCFEESISAYYYTPVHSIFVGALVALGVCLIAIRGNTDAENVLLNVAGVLAPIVAFVPTALPKNTCTRYPYTGGNTLANINNNLVAFGIALVLALGIAVVTVFLPHKDRHLLRDVLHDKESGKVNKHTVWVLVIDGAVLAFGSGWYVFSRSTFLDHAHGGGAALLFGLVGVVVLINGLGSPSKRYRIGYLIVVAAMAVGLVAIVIAGVVDSDWRHQILWLELVEVSLLLAYWPMQTAELWDPGVPTGDERAERSERARNTRPGKAFATIARPRRHQ